MFTSARVYFVLATLAVVGCATAPKTDAVIAKVTNQASFDLQCPKESLEAQKLSDDAAMMGVRNATYGVRGCGKQATYKTSCGMGSCSVFNEAQSRTGSSQ
jgi:hypothetical protein